MILITGASGFLGKNLVDYFNSLNLPVVPVFRKNSNLWRYKDYSGPTIVAELSDNIFWKDFFDHNPVTEIFHFATYGSYPNQKSIDTTLNTNIFDSLIFAKHAFQCVTLKSFFSAGSGSEYDPNKGLSSETDISKAANIYGATKTAFGITCSKLAENYMKNFLHLRFFSMFGPWEEPTRLIPQLLLNGMQGKWPSLSNPNVSRDYIYVEDVVKFLHKQINNKEKFNDTINISSGISTSILKFTEIIENFYDITEPKIWGNFPTRDFDREQWAGTTLKAQEIYQWQATTNLMTGIKKFDAWIREQNEYVSSIYRKS